MAYPQTWRDLRAAADVWTPPEEAAEAVGPVLDSAVPYRFCTAVYDALAPLAPGLDMASLGIALGAAHLINVAQLDQRQGEALAFLIAHAGRYDAEQA